MLKVKCIARMGNIGALRTAAQNFDAYVKKVKVTAKMPLLQAVDN